MRSRAIYFLLWFSSREGRTTNEAMSEAVPHRWLWGRGLIVDFRVLLTCIQFQAGKHTQQRSSNFVTVRFFLYASQSNIEWKRNLLYFNAIILEDFFHRFISDRKWQWLRIFIFNNLNQILNENETFSRLHNNTWGIFPLIMCNNKGLIINKNDLPSSFSTQLNQKANEDGAAFLLQYNNFWGTFHIIYAQ